jgi:hypothetical protein
MQVISSLGLFKRYIMFVKEDDFEKWMQRIMERFNTLETKIFEKKKYRHKYNGELLFDNQDICFMFNISKRTLQRYRSSGRLPYRRIEKKTFYLESDVNEFIKYHINDIVNINKGNEDDED